MIGGTDRARAVITLLLWLVFLGCVLLGLHGLGGALAAPPLTDPSSLNDWLEERLPAEAAFALLRLAGLATAWYLVGAIVLDALAHLSQVPAMVRWADLYTIPAVRRLANATAGVSVAAAALTTGAGTPFAGLGRSSPPSAEVISLLAHATSPSSTAGAGPDASNISGANDAPTYSADDDGDEQRPPLPTLRRLPDTPEAPPPPPATPPAGPNAPPAPGPEARPPSAPPQDPSEPEPSASVGPDPNAQVRSELATDRWEVRPGQHFWAVAESVLAAEWPRKPSDDEVDPYWRQLVAANRSILRDPDNADLLYPGQVITVPPPPPAPPTPGRANRGPAQPH